MWELKTPLYKELEGGDVCAKQLCKHGKIQRVIEP
jgi:hypothetical protein